MLFNFNLKYLMLALFLIPLNYTSGQVVKQSFTIQGQLLDNNNNPIVGEGISYQLSNPDIPWTGPLQLLGVATDNNGKYSGVVNMSSIQVGEEVFVNSLGSSNSSPQIEIFINSGSTSIAGPMPIHSVPTSIVSSRSLNADNADKINNKDLSQVADEFEYGHGVPLGGIIMYSGIIDGTLFDGTGKGIPGSRMENWALCNGSNSTPDLRGRFIVGRSDSSPLTQPGDGGEDGSSSGYTNSEGNRQEYAQVGSAIGYGGLYEVTLTAAQSGLPAHNHSVTFDADSHGWGHSGVTSRGDEVVHQVIANTSTNTPQNAQEAHENKPPWYVLAFLKRIF